MKLNNILSRLPVATIIFTSRALLASLNRRASKPAFGRRLSEQIIDAILGGEPGYLEADNQQLLAIHTRPEWNQAPGAAVILHGRGSHPLRIRLQPDAGAADAGFGINPTYL